MTIKQIARLWSVRLALVAGVVGAYFAANPGDLATLMAYVPPQYKPVASVLAGLLIFATATGTRLAPQRQDPPAQ